MDSQIPLQIWIVAEQYSVKVPVTELLDQAIPVCVTRKSEWSLHMENQKIPIVFRGKSSQFNEILALKQIISSGYVLCGSGVVIRVCWDAAKLSNAKPFRS